jgi:hypothetical protein
MGLVLMDFRRKTPDTCEAISPFDRKIAVGRVNAMSLSASNLINIQGS